MKYKLLEANTSEKLNDSVQELLDDGWELRGNTRGFYHQGWSAARFFQAMTKGEKKKEDQPKVGGFGQ